MSRTDLKNILTLIAVALFAIAFFLSKPETSPAPAVVPQSTTSSTSTPLLQSCADCYRVLKVVDGDTLDVDIEGVTSRIRVIGINTPEVEASGTTECFGEEASARAHELLEEQFVRLVYDPVAGDKDKYGRLLRHVTISTTTPQQFGLMMVDDGYAKVYAYKNQKFAGRSTYESAQTVARDAQRGLWGACKK